MLTVLLFLAGLLLVWKGADYLIEGAAGLAHRFGVRTFIIGLTVVSFGTSAPELVVNLFAAARGAGSLAFGNVLGSNVANLLLVLGLAAILGTVRADKTTLRWELPATALATALVAAMIYIPPGRPHILSRLDGALLILLFLAFLYYTYRISKGGPTPPSRLSTMRPLRSTLFVIGGSIGLGLGGHWLVTGGLDLADRLNITEGFVGFFFIAVGTSLPEIAATISAARKQHLELALGNIIGSNLFNLLFVLGITGVVLPLEADGDTGLQLASATLAPLLVLLILLPKRRLRLPAGILLILAYAAWLLWLLLQGPTIAP